MWNAGSRRDLAYKRCKETEEVAETTSSLGRTDKSEPGCGEKQRPIGGVRQKKRKELKKKTLCTERNKKGAPDVAVGVEKSQKKNEKGRMSTDQWTDRGVHKATWL